MSTDRQWWKSAVVYQIYPRSFADADGDGIGDLAGITRPARLPAALGVDVIWLSPVYPSPQDDNGYDISDYQDIDPTFGTLADFDELLAAVHERGMKLVMDLVVNHTSDEHPWFVESRSSPRQPEARLVLVAPAAPGMEAGAPGAEPNNWVSFFSGSAWELDEPTGEYYLHLFSRKQPDLNWENPRGPRGGLRDDALVARPGRRRLPDGRHQHDLQGHRPAGRPGRRRRGPTATARRTSSTGRGSTSSSHEMHRAVLAGRRRPAHGRRDARASPSTRRALFTDPARAEVDMVFQFEHVGLDHGASKWDVHPLDLRRPEGHPRPLAGRPRRRRLEQPLLGQPRPAAGRLPVRRRRRSTASLSAKTLGTLLHLHRGTPYVYQGEELGMTNYPSSGIAEFRDIESLNHYADAVARGADPERGAGRAAGGMSRDNARTPMQWDPPGPPAAGLSRRAGAAPAPARGAAPAPAGPRSSGPARTRSARRPPSTPAGRSAGCRARRPGPAR